MYEELDNQASWLYVLDLSILIHYPVGRIWNLLQRILTDDRSFSSIQYFLWAGHAQGVSSNFQIALKMIPSLKYEFSQE